MRAAGERVTLARLCGRCGNALGKKKRCCAEKIDRQVAQNPERAELLEPFTGPICTGPCHAKRLVWRATCACARAEISAQLEQGTAAEQADPRRKQRPPEMSGTREPVTVSDPAALNAMDFEQRSVGPGEEFLLNGSGELPRLLLGGTFGLKTLAGGPALSSVDASEAPCSVSIAGVATPDGLRTPPQWVVSQTERRPKATPLPSWGRNGGMLTVSAGGFRCYTADGLEAGTGIIWLPDNAGDAFGQLCDPEIVVTTWNGVGPAPGVEASAGGQRVRAADAAVWTFASLCTCLHPWEAPQSLTHNRPEDVVTATALALLWWAFTLEAEHAWAERILTASTGRVELIARSRIAAHGMTVRPPVGRFVHPAGPWRSRQASREVPHWAKEGVSLVNAHLSTNAVAVHYEEGARSVGAHALEDNACVGWSGPWLRFDVAATFETHTFGGQNGITRATDLFALSTGASARLPASDAVVRPGGRMYLPCVDDNTGGSEAAAALLLLAIGIGAPRRRGHGTASKPVSRLVWLAPRDWLLFGDRSEWTVGRRPASTRRGSGIAPPPVFTKSVLRKDVTIPVPDWSFAEGDEADRIRSELWREYHSVEENVLPQEVVQYVHDLIRCGPPSPQEWRELREMRVERIEQHRKYLHQSSDFTSSAKARGGHLVTFGDVGGAKPRTQQERAHGVFPVPRRREEKDPPSGVTRHLSAVNEPGWPRLRAAVCSGGLVTTIVPPVMSIRTVRRGILAGCKSAPHAQGADPWKPRPGMRSSDASSQYRPGVARSALGDVIKTDSDVPIAQKNLGVVNSSELADIERACAEIAENPMTREAAIHFRNGLPVATLRKPAARDGRVRNQMVREDYSRLIAVAYALPVNFPVDVARLLWSVTTWPARMGGGASRKRVATESHVASVIGAAWESLEGDTLTAVQRWLSRGLFVGSPTLTLPPERMQKSAVLQQGLVVPPEAKDWVRAAYRDTVAARSCRAPYQGVQTCVQCRRPLHDAAAWLELHCVDCEQSKLRPMAGGGGTLADTRRMGGSHTAEAAYLEEINEDRSDFREAGMTVRKAQAAFAKESTLPRVCVMTAVFPSGQAGARDQETPSLRVAIAGAILRASLSTLVDPDWSMALFRPDQAARHLSSAPIGAPMAAYDARAATDGMSHEATDMQAEEAPAILTDFVPGEEEPVNLVPLAAFEYTRYDSVPMLPDEWAKRLWRGTGSYAFRSAMATPCEIGYGNAIEYVIPEKFLGTVQKVTIDASDILFVGGPTGSGKTVAAASLGAQRTVMLPTRLAIMSAAAYAATPEEQSAAVFFEAGSLAGQRSYGAAIHDGTKWTAATRDDADSLARQYATPYQVSHRDTSGRNVVVDEVHERTFERMAALSRKVLDGSQLTLCSATAPEILGEAIAGRAIRKVNLKGPVLKVRVLPYEFKNLGAYTGRNASVNVPADGLLICGSIRETAEMRRTIDAVEIHGLLPGDVQMSAGRQAVLERRPIAATIGIVGSSVTLPGRRTAYLAPSAMKKRRYHAGIGQEYRTPLTRAELLQIAGRAGREPPHEATFYIEGATPSGWHTSWSGAIDACGIKFAEPVQGARCDDFLSQVRSLGDPTLGDDEAALTCQLMETTVALIPWARHCVGAIDRWLGGSIESYSRSLNDKCRQCFESGQDPARQPREEGDDDDESGLRPTLLLEHPYLHAGPSEMLPTDDPQATEAYAVGVALRLGPSMPGAFGVHGGAETKLARWASETLAGCGRGLPGAPVDLPDEVFLDGHSVGRGSVPCPTQPTVGDTERDVIARSRRKPRKNTCGGPMGGSANGATLNAATSNTNKCSDLLWLIAQRAAVHPGDRPRWLDKYAEVPRPKISSGLVPAAPSSSGGDDEGGPADVLRVAASGAFRSALELRQNMKKTHVTPSFTRPLRDLVEDGPNTDIGRCGGFLHGLEAYSTMKAACDAFGTGLAQATGKGAAPFLERYFRPSENGMVLSDPGRAVSDAKGLYALFAGRSVDSRVWDAYRELATDVTGTGDWNVHQLIATYRPVDTRRAMLVDVPRLTATTDEVFVDLDLTDARRYEVSAPTRAGKAAGDPEGVKAIRAAIAFRAFARSRIKDEIKISFTPRAYSAPKCTPHADIPGLFVFDGSDIGSTLCSLLVAARPDALTAGVKLCGGGPMKFGSGVRPDVLKGAEVDEIMAIGRKLARAAPFEMKYLPTGFLVQRGRRGDELGWHRDHLSNIPGGIHIGISLEGTSRKIRFADLGEAAEAGVSVSTYMSKSELVIKNSHKVEYESDDHLLTFRCLPSVDPMPFSADEPIAPEASTPTSGTPLMEADAVADREITLDALGADGADALLTVAPRLRDDAPLTRMLERARTTAREWLATIEDGPWEIESLTIEEDEAALQRASLIVYVDDSEQLRAKIGLDAPAGACVIPSPISCATPPSPVAVEDDSDPDTTEASIPIWTSDGLFLPKRARGAAARLLDHEGWLRPPRSEVQRDAIAVTSLQTDLQRAAAVRLGSVRVDAAGQIARLFPHKSRELWISDAAELAVDESVAILHDAIGDREFMHLD
jgi:hypothetical protein